MKEIKVNRGKVVFEGQNGQRISVDKTDPYIHRRRYALRLSARFIADNSEKILNLMGAGISEELDVFKDKKFQRMIRALEYARVGKKAFMKEITEVVSTSTHHPPEIQASLIANSFTSYVYSEIERLGLERRSRA